SAVPEAETWAMMAMGLGLVGLQLRRRKNAEKIV
ncbi:MAG TPA: PEPxxWA-CTERM sorting domain-containing protein, partial [Thiobacillaceae bacterium]|nr:PEPxxWA-CTERM sorting domain-containing protein [Thiobacillaceae bacterium]